MKLPKRVTIVEVGPRDGFQNEKQFIFQERHLRAQPSNTGDRPEWGDGRPSGLANDLRLLPVFDPTPAAENGGAYPGGHGRAGIQPGEHRGSHSGKSHFIGGNSNNVI